MRIVLIVATAASAIALGGVRVGTADAKPFPLKQCGKVVVRQPAGVSPNRISRPLSTRGLTCRSAKITARYIARRMRSPQSYKVRGNTFDCEAYPGQLPSCVGIRSGDEDPTVGVFMRVKRR